MRNCKLEAISIKADARSTIVDDDMCVTSAGPAAIQRVVAVRKEKEKARSGATSRLAAKHSRSDTQTGAAEAVRPLRLPGQHG